MNFKRVSKSIKANIAGVGGSSQNLQIESEPAEKNDDNNCIGPLHSQDNHIFMAVREQWNWVLEDICSNNTGATMTRVDTAEDLPSGKLASVAKLAAASHPNTSRSSRRRNQKNNTAITDANCILRVDVISNTKLQKSDTRPWILKAFHCTSQAFDGLDDKDELARTLKRCRCEDMEISPPSQLINWDVTKVSCKIALPFRRKPELAISTNLQRSLLCVLFSQFFIFDFRLIRLHYHYSRHSQWFE